MQPHDFFWNGRGTAERIAQEFCIAYEASFAQLFWRGQVRSRSYDVIRGTASDRFFMEIVFSATELAAID